MQLVYLPFLTKNSSRVLLLFLAVLVSAQTRVTAQYSLYVGESVYVGGPSYTGIIDAASWTSDNQSVAVSGDGNGAEIRVGQYFSGTAIVSCYYGYTYYVGASKYHQTGHLEYTVSAKKSTVTLSNTEIVLAPGEEFTLSYSNSSGYTLWWHWWGTDDSNIATVDGNNRADGQTTVVKGIKPGECIITLYATTGQANPTCKVIVRDVPATSISLSPEILTLVEGKTGSFKVVRVPSNASSAITWEISNPSIAKIASNGRITAISEGKTQVTATTSNNLRATAVLEVVPQPRSVRMDPEISIPEGYSIVPKV